MFELSVALKYLVPRMRQISVSVISLISVLVIALVVWLIVVFFSVTNGLEKSWIQKLIALTAPVRVTPTEAYYQSYYYQVDTLSNETGYTVRNIAEKLSADTADSYDPEFDEQLPADFPKADRDRNGEVKDLVKLAYAAIQGVEGVSGIEASDYEMTVGNLKILMTRNHGGEINHTSVSQASYLGSFDPENESLQKSILPASSDDLQHGARVVRAPVWETASWKEIPSDPKMGDGILLPKGYREAGVLVGDQGHISYTTPTTSSLQEQQIPVYVAGFYDPGILPMGGKFVIVNQDVTSIIRSAHNPEDTQLSNGFNVRFDELKDAEKVKEQLQIAFREQGIDKYWRVETFRDYDYAKDMLQQLRSEKNLFMIIATVIIIVACSNIISMLIILVKDKKQEIGILRSMGASSKSIALIFGTCGVVMGIVGSFIGVCIAMFTLQNLQVLIDLLSQAQGFDAFNPLFYGDTLPNELSFEALTFVLVSTGLISLIAGIVPAVKASMLQPTAILRSE